jgi:hypothetical protein
MQARRGARGQVQDAGRAIEPRQRSPSEVDTRASCRGQEGGRIRLELQRHHLSSLSLASSPQIHLLFLPPPLRVHMQLAHTPEEIFAALPVPKKLLALNIGPPPTPCAQTRKPRAAVSQTSTVTPTRRTPPPMARWRALCRGLCPTWTRASSRASRVT